MTPAEIAVEFASRAFQEIERLASELMDKTREAQRKLDLLMAKDEADDRD